MNHARVQTVRPELVRTVVPYTGASDRPVRGPVRVLHNGWLRKCVLLGALAMIWEVYGRLLDNSLLFPSFTDTVAAFADNLASGVLPARTWTSLTLLLDGYALGVSFAALLSVAATNWRIVDDLLALLAAMFNPLPAIALLPLAMLWFGLGRVSMLVVLVHSVIWVVALNMQAGFRAVSPTLRMVGRNYGLRGIRYVAAILLPAALPSILTGLKAGWAFAWRTLIAAELVFGVTAGSGGLGWFIFENKNLLDIPAVFAGLLSIVLIGLAVDNLVFRQIERRTVRRWGMEH